MEEREFYREEVRCGFPVTEKMKRVWAVQLSMLDEVERICRKYGLRYFADSGTLIGAVRDKGYIPWDDDIDLAMLREDYERFVKVAPRELGEGLKLQTVYTEENYLRGHAQIRDGRTTGYNEEDARAGYNCGIFIDIFPLDGMPDGKLAARLWAFQVRLCWMVLYTWYRYDYYEKKTLAGRLLYEFGRLLHIPMRRAYRRYEMVCARYKGKHTKRVCDTVFISQLAKNTWERKWFEDVVYLPFENRQIPAPVGYDGRLRAEYGEYWKPAKAPTMHGGLVLDPEVPYEEYLKRK